MPRWLAFAGMIFPFAFALFAWVQQPGEPQKEAPPQFVSAFALEIEPGHEQAFIERFQKRAKIIDQAKGFKGMFVLQHVSHRDLLPPVPTHLDGTPLYRMAIVQLQTAQQNVPKPTWDAAYNFISTKPTAPVNLTDVRKVLQASQPALKTLRQAVKLPHMRLTNWDVENPAVAVAVSFPQISQLREFAHLLSAEALWRKQNGDMDGAVDSCIVAFQLTRRMGDEPSLIGFLVQGTIFVITERTLWRVLSDADASPQAYHRLLAELQARDIDRDFTRALQMERAEGVIRWFELLQKVSLRELQTLSSSNPRWNLAFYLRSKRTLLAENELLVLRYFERLIAYARKGPPYDLAALNRMNTEIERRVRGTSLLPSGWGGLEVVWQPYEVAAILTPVFTTQAFDKAAQYHALQRLMQVAVALRLYRLEHGRCPDDLQALVPKYLPKVPIDPFDGKPLRYHRLAKGFKVWSIGPNLKDDGGMEVRNWWQRGDIVWQSK